MKILLIVPPYRTCDSLQPQLFPMPLGLMYIGAVLKKKGHKVVLKDFLITEGEKKDHIKRPQTMFQGPPYKHYGLSLSECFKWLKHNAKKYDAIGVYSGQCAVWECPVKIIKYLVKHGHHVVVGGPYATTATDDLMLRCQPYPPQVIVIGEGESIVGKDAFQIAVAKEVSGCTQVLTQKYYLPVEFSKLPIPDYSLMNFDDYPKYNGMTRGVLTGSRGCPYACKFCSVHTIMGREYRTVSKKKLRKNLIALAEEGVNYFCFLDDNLFLSKKQSEKVLGVIEELRQTDKRFKHAKFHNEEGMQLDMAARPGFVARVKAAGFDKIKLGLETLDEDTLKDFNKPYLKENLARALAECKKAGIRPMAFYIIGFPNDTIQSVVANIRELAGYGMIIRTNNLKLYPGTETTQDYLRQGFITAEYDWRNSSFYTPDAGHMGFSSVRMLKRYLAAVSLLPVSVFDASEEEIIEALKSKGYERQKTQIVLTANGFFRAASWARLLEILVLRFLPGMGVSVAIGQKKIVAKSVRVSKNQFQAEIAKMYGKRDDGAFQF